MCERIEEVGANISDGAKQELAPKAPADIASVPTFESDDQAWRAFRDPGSTLDTRKAARAFLEWTGGMIQEGPPTSGRDGPQNMAQDLAARLLGAL
jgi:hypothetical protein